LQLHAPELQPGAAPDAADRGPLGAHAMSLLKRLETGSAVTTAPVAPPSGDAARGSTPVAQPEPAFRQNTVQTQATEAQRSLKERVKRKLISELDPSLDTAMVDEVRHR